MLYFFPKTKKTDDGIGFLGLIQIQQHLKLTKHGKFNMIFLI